MKKETKEKKDTLSGFLQGVAFVLIILLMLYFVLFLASGSYLKPKYLEPHGKEYYKKFDDPRLQVAAHGLLSPNSHNMQPFLILLDGEKTDTFYVYTDGEKKLFADPNFRETLVSTGAFLQYIQIGATNLSYTLDIELFPNGEWNEETLMKDVAELPVAKLTLTPSENEVSPLYDCMYLPNCNRSDYRMNLPDEEQLDTLLGISEDSEITVKMFTDTETVKQLGNFAVEGKAMEFASKEVSSEYLSIIRRNEHQKNRFRNGFSVEAQGTKGFKKLLIQGSTTLLPFLINKQTLKMSQMAAAKQNAQNTPCYLMVISDGNSRTQQVQAGMLYAKMLLTAHTMGIVMHPLSQAISDFPEMETLLEEMHQTYAEEGQRIQMFSRIGFPTVSYPLSPRQDLAELLIYQANIALE